MRLCCFCNAGSEVVEGQQGKQIAFACACACVALELCEPVFNLNGLKFAVFFSLLCSEVCAGNVYRCDQACTYMYTWMQSCLHVCTPWSDHACMHMHT